MPGRAPRPAPRPSRRRASPKRCSSVWRGASARSRQRCAKRAARSIAWITRAAVREATLSVATCRLGWLRRVAPSRSETRARRSRPASCSAPRRWGGYEARSTWVLPRYAHPPRPRRAHDARSPGTGFGPIRGGGACKSLPWLVRVRSCNLTRPTRCAPRGPRGPSQMTCSGRNWSTSSTCATNCCGLVGPERRALGAEPVASRVRPLQLGASALEPENDVATGVQTPSTTTGP
jgi:hypothetical protein